DFGEMRVLAQETIAGMNRLDVADFRGGDDVIDLEVAFLRGRRADADGLVSQPEIDGVLVGLRVDDDRLHIEALAGADDAQRNFTPVGDQNACENENSIQNSKFKIQNCAQIELRARTFYILNFSF